MYKLNSHACTITQTHISCDMQRERNDKYLSEEKNQLNVFLCLQGTTFCFHHISPERWGQQKPTAALTTSQTLSQIPSCCKSTDTTQRHLGQLSYT